MRGKIICLDFDGVVHSYTSGWKGPWTIPDPPVDGAFYFMGLALASGYRVAILSSRGRYAFGRWAMRRWLKRHAGNHWYDDPAGAGLERVEFPRNKPPAMVTIDDRAITFTGTFPEPRVLERFVPWNRQKRSGSCPSSSPLLR